MVNIFRFCTHPYALGSLLAGGSEGEEDDCTDPKCVGHPLPVKTDSSETHYTVDRRQWSRCSKWLREPPSIASANQRYTHSFLIKFAHLDLQLKTPSADCVLEQAIDALRTPNGKG